MVRLGKEHRRHAAPPEFALDSVAIREGTAEQLEEIGHAHTPVAVSGGYRPRPGRARWPPGHSEDHGLFTASVVPFSLRGVAKARCIALMIGIVRTSQREVRHDGQRRGSTEAYA